MQRTKINTVTPRLKEKTDVKMLKVGIHILIVSHCEARNASIEDFWCRKSAKSLHRHHESYSSFFQPYRLSESAVACGLWHHTVGLSIWGRRWRLAHRPLCQHQSRTSQNRSVVFLSLLTRFSGLALLIVFLEGVNRRGLLCHVVNHERLT